MRKVHQNESKFFKPAPNKANLCRFLLLLSMGLWVGCGSSKPKPLPPGDPSLPEIDVLQLKENSEEALKLAQENRIELQGLKAHVMELEGRVAGLSEAVANFPLSQFDTLQVHIDSVQTEILILNDRISRIPHAPPPRTLSTFSPSSAGGTSQGKLIGNLNTGASEGEVSPSVEKGTMPPSVKSKENPKNGNAPKAGVAESQAYRQAFDTFYKAEYAKARKQFQDLAEKWPTGSFAGNSLYWIAECDFSLGKYALAITGYKKVIALPESEKADDAQLKLGYAHLKLGDKKAAAEAFRKLVSLFPDSEYVERAKEELGKLD